MCSVREGSGLSLSFHLVTSKSSKEAGYSINIIFIESTQFTAKMKHVRVKVSGGMESIKVKEGLC